MTDRRANWDLPIWIKGIGSEVQITKSFRGANDRGSGGEGDYCLCACACNNKLAVTRYKLTRVALDISLQSRYVDTRRYIYI